MWGSVGAKTTSQHLPGRLKGPRTVIAIVSIQSRIRPRGAPYGVEGVYYVRAEDKREGSAVRAPARDGWEGITHGRALMAVVLVRAIMLGILVQCDSPGTRRKPARGW